MEGVLCPLRLLSLVSCAVLCCRCGVEAKPNLLAVLGSPPPKYQHFMLAVLSPLSIFNSLCIFVRVDGRLVFCLNNRMTISFIWYCFQHIKNTYSCNNICLRWSRCVGITSRYGFLWRPVRNCLWLQRWSKLWSMAAGERQGRRELLEVRSRDHSYNRTFLTLRSLSGRDSFVILP